MTEEKMRAMFTLADIGILRVKRLPNAYYAPDVDRERRIDYLERDHAWAPWWFVKTAAGWVEVGWRKRVIAIDWEDCGPLNADVTTDDVTKHLSLVHAWTEAKAVEYLKALAPHFNHEPAAPRETETPRGEA